MQNWREIHDAVEREFAEDGVIGPRLLEFLGAEETFRSFVLHTYSGHRLVLDAFFEFMIETTQITGSETTDEDAMGYVRRQLVIDLWSFRAADRCFLGGYPGDAFGLLRDLKDRAIFAAAIAIGRSDLWSLEGLDHLYGAEELSPMGEEELREITRKKKAEERRVLNVVRDSSGLTRGQAEAIKQWNESFNWEVHGSRFSKAAAIEVGADRRITMSVVPRPDDLTTGLYLNRSLEIAWMRLRTLPFLQAGLSTFGPDWARRWHLVDEALRAHVSANVEPGKPLFDALIAFIEKVFPFAPQSTHYVHRTPRDRPSTE